jgi:long-subunit acyl-CoA synthetase (AMP-forming)
MTTIEMANDIATTPSVATLCDAFEATVATHPDRPALRSPGGAEVLTWREYAERADRIAAGLAALGVRRGDVVALLLTQRLEANCVDTAAIQLGAVTVPLYPGDSFESLEHILTDCDARIVVTEDSLAEKAARASRDVVHFVTVDGPRAGMTTLDDLEALGDPAFDLDACRRAVDPDDRLSILYTSGTTGPPKGVIHTHANALAGLASLESESPDEAEVRYVSFLPFAHLGEHGLGYWRALVRGSTITFCPDPTQLAAALVDARPTWIFAPPRIWERLKLSIEGTGITDARVIRRQFGLVDLTQAITGAASCPADVLAFFYELGLPMSELWGMTEAWIATLTTSDADIGTVGRALPGFELRLADDGELLVRGAAISEGYLNRPDATATAFDADGWLRTGDLATIDEEGRVSIIDRKKEMIISSGGHNMSPANIEAQLKSASRLIAHACCVGDGRDFNVALIVLNPEAARRLAPDRSIDLARDPAVLEEVAAGVARANDLLDDRERVVRHAVVPDQWAPGAELTPTMKLRRRSIHARYGDVIERLYAA